MKYKSNPAWDRIAAVITHSGEGSLASFSNKLGLTRPENLYQIKKGNNGISKKLAQAIHTVYPQFSVSWLMLGDQGEADTSGLICGLKKRKISIEVIPELVLPVIGLLEKQLSVISENYDVRPRYLSKDMKYPDLDEIFMFFEEVREKCIAEIMAANHSCLQNGVKMVAPMAL